MSLSDDVHVIPKLFSDAVEQLGKLVQNEANLARAEISQKIAQAGMGAAYVAGAAVLAIPALVLLLMTFALWLGQMGLSPVIAHLVATACGAVGSVILLLIGMRCLKAENLTPKVTLQQVKRDAAVVKGMAQ